MDFHKFHIIVRVSGEETIQKVYMWESEHPVYALNKRLATVEAHFVDTRRTYKFKNHVSQKYLGSTGINSTSSSTHSHYSIQRD